MDNVEQQRSRIDKPSLQINLLRNRALQLARGNS